MLVLLATDKLRSPRTSVVVSAKKAYWIFCAQGFIFGIIYLVPARARFQRAHSIKGSYTKEEGMQLNGNHVDGEILSVTKNKYAFTEVS